MTAHTYDVDVWREGRWWLFRIPELDTVGQARSLAEVPEEAEGIIEAWNAAPPAPFELNVTSLPRPRTSGTCGPKPHAKRKARATPRHTPQRCAARS